MIEQAIAEIRQNLSAEYNNSGLKDIEIIKLLELIHKHLSETKESNSFAVSAFYTAGGYFLYVALLLKSLTSIFIPDMDLLAIDGIDNVIEAVSIRRL